MAFFATVGRKILLDHADVTMALLEDDPEELAKAKKYLKIMKLSLDNPGFVQEEEARLRKLLAPGQKMSAIKLDELAKTANVLTAFMEPNLFTKNNKEQEQKDEL